MGSQQDPIPRALPRPGRETLSSGNTEDWWVKLLRLELLLCPVACLHTCSPCPAPLVWRVCRHQQRPSANTAVLSAGARGAWGSPPRGSISQGSFSWWDALSPQGGQSSSLSPHTLPVTATLQCQQGPHSHKLCGPWRAFPHLPKEGTKPNPQGSSSFHVLALLPWVPLGPLLTDLLWPPLHIQPAPPPAAH